MKAVRFTQTEVEAADSDLFWQTETGVAKDAVNGWLTFIDPFHLDAESWLRSWNRNYPGVPVYGGLAQEERDWLWRRPGAAVSTHGSRELASQCVDSLITTLRETMRERAG